MKNSLLFITVLIATLSTSNANTTPNAATADSKDIYEVHEYGDSITLVNPKSDKATLRDIVYYHVVETAYGLEKNDEETTFEPDVQIDDILLTEPGERVKEHYEENTSEITTKPLQRIIETEAKPKHLNLNEIKEKYKRKYDNVNGENFSTGRVRRKRDTQVRKPTIQNGDDIYGRSQLRSGKARTYGMRVTPGGTYVWNDLFSPLRYQGFERETNERGPENQFVQPRIDIRYDHAQRNDKDDFNTHDRMEEMFATLKPIGFDKEETYEDKVTDEKVEEGKLDEEQEEKSRTYGMKLSNGSGYIWNDIFTEPGLSFDVGELKDSNKMNMTREPTLEIPETPIGILPSTNEETDDTEETGDKEEPIDDLHDIFVHIAGLKRTTSSPILDVRLQETKGSDKVDAQEEDKENLTVTELLQSEEFWTWVAEWTQMLMDIISKYTKKAVEAEVKRQFRIKKMLDKNQDTLLESQKDEIDLSKNTEKDIDRNKNSNGFIIIKDNKLIIDGIEMPLTHSSNFQTEKELEKKKNETSKRRKDKKKKPSSHKDQSVEKKNKTDEISNRRNQPEYKVQVENVYGNAVGSEKVTNIFVFYPKETDKIVEDLKPIGENGVLIIKPDGQTNEDKEESPNKEVSTDSEREETDSPKEDSEEEYLKPEGDTKPEKEVDSKPESDKHPADVNSNLESNKDPEKDGAEEKESNTDSEPEISQDKQREEEREPIADSEKPEEINTGNRGDSGSEN